MIGSVPEPRRRRGPDPGAASRLRLPDESVNINGLSEKCPPEAPSLCGLTVILSPVHGGLREHVLTFLN